MIILTDEQLETGSCIYQLYYGDRFAIIKAKTLAGSIYLFVKGYAAFIGAGGGTGNAKGGKGQNEWDGTNSYYFKFYKYIHDNPGKKFRVEVIMESNSGYYLLKQEQRFLNITIQNNKCLNSNVTSYIPKFNKKTGMYGWITKRNVADFRRFLSS